MNHRDAETVKITIDELLDAMSIAELANESGISVSTVYRIRRTYRVSKAVFERLDLMYRNLSWEYPGMLY